MLIERGVVVEAVSGEVFEGFEEEGGQGFLVIIGDAEDLAGGFERFVALGVADFGEDQSGGGGGGEADFDGHRAAKLGREIRRGKPAGRGGWMIVGLGGRGLIFRRLWWVGLVFC